MSVGDDLMNLIREELRNFIQDEVQRNSNPLMTEKDVMEWLGMKDRRTLEKWRQNGLKFYRPYGGRRYYFEQDVKDFVATRGDAY